MRVITSFVLAGWILGGVASPCLAWSACARTARHQCCCGGAANCCCRLSAAHSPVSSMTPAALPTTMDLQSLPAAEASTLPAFETATQPDIGPAGDPAVSQSLPSYLSLHAFRC
jgi:hypothetical protein